MLLVLIDAAEHLRSDAPAPWPEAAAPTARQMLLNLLLVADEGRMDAAQAVRACSLFGISANNARVALNRLVASGLADVVARGAYQLGDKGRVLGNEIGSWRSAELALHPWDGGWIVALTGGLGRVDRNALRIRERALALVGMKPLDPEVYVRPANIVGGIAHFRSRLFALGLEEGASVFSASDFDSAREARARELWDVKALIAAYRQGRVALDESLLRLPNLPLADAAKHSYLAGNRAIRQLVFDPLLPEPLIAVSERCAFRELVLRYEDLGRSIWRKFYDSE